MSTIRRDGPQVGVDTLLDAQKLEQDPAKDVQQRAPGEKLSSTQKAEKAKDKGTARAPDAKTPVKDAATPTVSDAQQPAVDANTFGGNKDAMIGSGTPAVAAQGTSEPRFVQPEGNNAQLEFRRSNEENSALIAKTFAPLVALLTETKTGEPGLRFQATDGLKDSVPLAQVPFKQVAWLARELQIDPSLMKTNERVRVVKQYQALTEQLLLAKKDDTVFAQKLSQMPAAARAQIQLASEAVQKAAATVRLADPSLWRKSIAANGKPSELKSKIEQWMKELAKGPSGATKDTDIEIPDLDLVAQETSLQKLSEAMFPQDTTVATRVGSALEKAAVEATARFAIGLGQGAVKSEAGAPYDPLANIDWANASVEELLQLVLMQGFRIESDMTRELLKDMMNVNRQKEQLRKLSTSAKQEKTKLERTMQVEWQELKASGHLNEKITFDEYKQWREFDFSAMNETLNEDGTRDYGLAAPQMQPLDMNNLPGWFKTGEVEKALSEEDPKYTQKLFGIEPKVDKKLRAIFDKLPHGEQTYSQWLQEDLGLVPAGSIQDVLDNLKQVKGFCGMDRAALDRATAASNLANVDGAKLDALTAAYTSVYKAEMLHVAFPEMVDDKALATAKKTLDDLLKGKGENAIDADTANAFNEWVATSGHSEMETYRIQVEEFSRQAKDPNQFRGGSENKKDGNVGWDDKIWTEVYGDGQSVPGNVMFVKGEDGKYTLVKRVDADMKVVADNGDFFANAEHLLDLTLDTAEHVGDQVGELVGKFTSRLPGGNKGGGDDEEEKKDEGRLPDATWTVDVPFLDKTNTILEDINNLASPASPASVTVIDASAYDGLNPQVDMQAREVVFTLDGERITVSFDEMAEYMGRYAAGGAAFGAGAGGAIGLTAGAAGGFVVGGVAGGIIGAIVGGIWNFGIGATPGAILGCLAGIAIGCACGTIIGGAAGVMVGGATGAAVGGVAGAAEGWKQARREKLSDYLDRTAKTGHDIPDDFATTVENKYKASLGLANPALQKAEDERQARINDIMTGLGDLAKTIDSDNPADVNSQYRRWARDNGLDTEWNAAQAEARAKKGLGPLTVREVPIDPQTGLRLEMHGNLAFFEAKMQEIDDKLESMKALGETEQLKLQRQMERQSKLLETLSNVMKSISGTEKTIRDNMR